MDLVIDKVMQLQHIDITNSYRAVEDLAGTAIGQPFLAGIAEACLLPRSEITSASRAPSNTGVPIGTPRPRSWPCSMHLMVIHHRQLGLILVGVYRFP